MLGRLLFVNDPALLDSIIRNKFGTVIVFSDNNNIPPWEECVLVGTILLPPPTIMSEYIDETVPIQKPVNDYYQYLCGYREPQMFFAGLLTLLLRGSNVALYFGQYENDMRFIEDTIRDVFISKYGLVPEVNGIQPTQPLNPRWDLIYQEVFMYDYITPEALLLSWPNMPFTEPVLSKLAIYYRPPVYTGMMEELNSIFQQMRVQMQDAGKALENPFVDLRSDQI
jgi:hypothetical protein